MATWDQWMPELTLAAPSAPEPLMHLCLNRAARTFLRTTRAWQEWLEPVSVAGGAFQEYMFEFPHGSELVRLERATLNGRPMEVAHSRDLPADPWAHERKGVAYLVTTNQRDFTVGAYCGEGAVQVYVSLQPGIRSATIPDSVAGPYHEAIREGAKAELLNQIGTDFYKPDQAAIALAFFRQAVDEATTDVWRSHTGRVSRGSASWL